jgi:hypothetical protein
MLIYLIIYLFLTSVHKTILSIFGAYILNYINLNNDLFICYLKLLNSMITGRLPSEAVLMILEELGKSGNASPLDKTKQRWLVYWHTLEEWGDIIYNWEQENGFIGSVCTLFELTRRGHN